MKQLSLLLLLIFEVNLSLSKKPDCQSNGFTCVDLNNFQQCTTSKLIGKPISCPENHICDVVNGSVTCNLTTKSVLETEIDCSNGGKFEAPLRYQYYECVWYFIFYQLVLQTCPAGQLFDPSLGTCVLPEAVTEPECKESGKHPALQCYQYYECVQKFWWYKVKLRTCPKGQGFDPFTKTCVCAGILKCSLPSSDSSCDGPGTQPSLNCGEYYECTRSLWWWKPVLKSCPENQNYDTKTCKCTIQKEAECYTEKCEGYRRYPAALANQYYECTVSQSGTEWELELKECPFGFFYFAKTEKCVFGYFG